MEGEGRNTRVETRTCFCRLSPDITKHVTVSMPRQARYPCKQAVNSLCWYRASSLPASHMVNVCYQELRKQDESGISNWCSYIRKIFFAANSCSYWVLRDNMTRSTLSVIKSNLEKVHINKCMDSIINAGPGNKLRTYKLIKKYFGLEK